jgi:hypothetical protein
VAKLTIDRGIPLPEPRHHGGRKPATPWNLLEVGDSVLLATEDAAKNAKAWAERNGRTFTRAKQPDGTGWRIWRKA